MREKAERHEVLPLKVSEPPGDVSVDDQMPSHEVAVHVPAEPLALFLARVHDRCANEQRQDVLAPLDVPAPVEKAQPTVDGVTQV